MNLSSTLPKDALAASDVSSGNELWAHDANTGMTEFVAVINPGAGRSFLGEAIVYDGILYFAADDGTHGSELWRYDAATGLAELVHDINPTGSSSPSEMAVYNGQLYFEASDGTGSELWRLDTGRDIVIADGFEN